MLRFNPVRPALTGEAVMPEPTDCCEVEVNVERVLEVPHSNQAMVGEPFGFTVPFVVAELVVTELADVVATVGRLAAVVKLKIASFCVPAAF